MLKAASSLRRLDEKSGTGDNNASDQGKSSSGEEHTDVFDLEKPRVTLAK